MPWRRVRLTASAIPSFFGRFAPVAIGAAAAALARLYSSLRLFVNFFQPSFKLAEKIRDGAKFKMNYTSG
jgi:hypothetical protein